MANPPRLTYITTATFPVRKASSLQVMQMCAAFSAAGALVKLVARQAKTQANVFEHYGLKPTFAFEPRAFGRWPRPGDIFQAQAAFAEVGRDWICYTRGQDLTASVVALGRGATAFVEAHALPATVRQRMLLTWIARHPRGRLIVISEPLREIYERKYGLSSFLAPDGVDLDRFEPPLTAEAAQQQLGLEPGPWIVYVGSLYAGRGLEKLFEAAVGLPARLLVVGGRDEAEVALWRERAQHAGLHNARFEGYQMPVRVPLYLFAGAVLAMPNSTRTLTGSGDDITAWMSPLKLYEYLAAGRPIVASNLPVLRSVLTHEHNALLAQPDETAPLRLMIQQALTDRALAQRLGQAARQTAQAHSWVARARSILELASFEKSS